MFFYRNIGNSPFKTLETQLRGSSMFRTATLGAAALTVALLSGPAMADDDVYSGFPVTVKGYSGKKTNSVSYSGQIARHALHDSLKKLAGKGNGKPNAELKAQLLSYFKNSDAGRAIIACDWNRKIRELLQTLPAY